MKQFFTFIIPIIVVALVGCNESDTSSGQAEVTNDEGTIVAVGDSLTEGLGVAEEFAYPALLENNLRAQGYHYRVINAGISGETSSGTLARIEWILTLNPDIVILVTGSNDGLRGLDPGLIKTNINNIIKALKDNKVIVVLGGMRIVQNLGEEYTTAFEKIYPEIAEFQQVILTPFFLEGVAAVPELNQADGIHPTAEGYRIVVSNLIPHVIEAIKTYRTTKQLNHVPKDGS
jgi:acyl-CoA thioesterase-1